MTPGMWKLMRCLISGWVRTYPGIFGRQLGDGLGSYSWLGRGCLRPH